MTVSSTLEAPTVQQGPPPAVAMTQLITGGLWLTKSIAVAAELGIADHLASGPQTAAALAAATNADASSLYRLLRALASVGIFTEDGDGQFSLTPLAATLQADVPGSVRDLAILWGDPLHWQAWAKFTETVRTGTDGFSLAFGIPLFAVFAQHPVQARLFEGAMTTFSAQEAEAVAMAYDYSRLQTLADIGGGHGLLLATILRHTPGLRGVLFELPFMVDGAAQLLAAQGVRDAVTIETGDFFAAVPASDGYILKNILHDFSDEQAVAILSSCRRAIKPGGRVLVVQEVLPPGNAPSYGKLLDMQMLLIGGKERTEAEYGALFAAAGLRLTRIIPTASPLAIIEAVEA